MNVYNVIQFFKIHNDVNEVKFQTKYSACFDISAFISNKEQIVSYTNENINVEKELFFDDSFNKHFIKINSFERVIIPTGLVFSFDCMYSLRIHSRSGLAVKKGIILANQEGIIDCDYNQQLFLCMINLTNNQQRIYNGDRIVQGEMVPNMHEMDSMSFIETRVKPIQISDRIGGFGSTGV